jgi:DNA-directed RNA polymerase specialized sigma24 family protein
LYAATFREGTWVLDNLADMVEACCLRVLERTKPTERADPDRLIVLRCRDWFAAENKKARNRERRRVCTVPLEELDGLAAPGLSAVDRAAVREALARLPEAERAVVALRLGLEGGEVRPWAAVATEVGLGLSRTKELYSQALGRLRRWLRDAP